MAEARKMCEFPKEKVKTKKRPKYPQVVVPLEERRRCGQSQFRPRGGREGGIHLR